jgi:DNA-binding CsgD family transcriptional regulator
MTPAPTGSPEQKRRMREAAQRRRAADLLRVTNATLAYAAAQLSNGIGPEEARMVGLEVSEELCEVARTLRRLTRLSARERRAEAARLRGAGLGTQEIATRLGVSMHSAWNYGRGLRSDGQPWADRAPG